jgi:hypothetical protein
MSSSSDKIYRDPAVARRRGAFVTAFSEPRGRFRKISVTELGLEAKLKLAKQKHNPDSPVKRTPKPAQAGAGAALFGF